MIINVLRQNNLMIPREKKKQPKIYNWLLRTKQSLQNIAVSIFWAHPVQTFHRLKTQISTSQTHQYKHLNTNTTQIHSYLSLMSCGVDVTFTAQTIFLLNYLLKPTKQFQANTSQIYTRTVTKTMHPPQAL